MSLASTTLSNGMELRFNPSPEVNGVAMIRISLWGPYVGRITLDEAYEIQQQGKTMPPVELGYVDEPYGDLLLGLAWANTHR